MLLSAKEKKIVQQTADYLEHKFSGESAGHDWWHMYRVWKNAIYIGQHEKVDMFVVQLAALLHDIADWKFNADDAGSLAARDRLEKMNVDEKIISHVCDIVKHVSFKGAKVKDGMSTLEGMVVQDADRLDTIGAIGMARTFAYGGSIGRPLHNPAQKPKQFTSFTAYKEKGNSSSINHFYEKLLLLKDLLHTKTAKKIAKQRHQFMEKYLKQFYNEREGKS